VFGSEIGLLHYIPTVSFPYPQWCMWERVLQDSMLQE
jgi:hypothetical protein